MIRGGSTQTHQMRGLIVGLGSIGRRHAHNWAALGYGPLAVCRQFNLAQPEPLGVDAAVYHDLDEALRTHRPDVVLVTNPTSLHVETACIALRAGAHVFVEKPLGCSLQQVAELLDAARAAGKLLLVGYNLRFHPGLVRLEQLVRQDAIGKIVSARAEYGEYLADWHPWEDYRHGYAARADLGGGAVLTLSHALDALCWLLGPPRRLTAMVAHASALEISADEVADITLEFDSRAIGTVHVDYVRRTPRRSIELVGDRGIARWEYERNRVEVYSAETRQWRVEDGDPRFDRNQMYTEELRHFVECAEGGMSATPRISGEQGAAVLAIALAALRSAAEGRAIELTRDTDHVTRRWLSHLNPRQ